MPIVLVAIGCLFALKSFGLLFNGGYTLGQRLGNGQLVVTTVPNAPVTQLRSPAVPLEMPSAPPAKLSWMRDVQLSQRCHRDDQDDQARREGRHGEGGRREASAKGAAARNQGPLQHRLPDRAPPVASAGERALLERLQKRREELDARGRELDLRESLLKAAEKKLETGQPSSKSAAKGGAEGGGAAGQGRDEAENARFKSVVTIYETMKPQGRRQDIRPPGHQGAARDGQPDQAADACPRSWRR